MAEVTADNNIERGALEKVKSERPAFYQSFRFRLIMSVTLVHIVLMGVFVMDIVNQQADGYRENLYNQGRSLSTLMSVASTDALLTENLTSLAEITSRIKLQPDVVYSDIINSQGYVLVSTDESRQGQFFENEIKTDERLPLDEGDHILDLREDIVVEGRKIGSVLLGLSTQRLNNALIRSRNQGVIFIILALLIGGLAAFSLSFFITRNLRELTSAAEKIGAGDLTTRVNINSHDETGLLASAFNYMGKKLLLASLEVHKEFKRRTAAERLAVVGELSASIAHEIRNPLSAIINSVKLLEDKQLSDKDHEEVAGIVNTESHRLQRILNDFLNFACMPEMKMTKNDLCKSISEAVILLKKDSAWNENIKINWSSLPDRQCYCLFSRDHIFQVLWNLFHNAIHAMPEGGTLSITVEQIDDYFNVCIADDGEGIPAKFMPNVLQPFVSGKKKGSGLGLSVVQRILMQHGTELSVTSQEGIGTKVSFKLCIA